MFEEFGPPGTRPFFPRFCILRHKHLLLLPDSRNFKLIARGLLELDFVVLIVRFSNVEESISFSS